MLLVRAGHEKGRPGPADADRVHRLRRPRGPELGVDHELLDRRGGEPPRLRPVGGDVPGGGHPAGPVGGPASPRRCGWRRGTPGSPRRRPRPRGARRRAGARLRRGACRAGYETPDPGVRVHPRAAGRIEPGWTPWSHPNRPPAPEKMQCSDETSGSRATPSSCSPSPGTARRPWPRRTGVTAGRASASRSGWRATARSPRRSCRRCSSGSGTNPSGSIPTGDRCAPTCSHRRTVGASTSSVRSRPAADARSARHG